METFLRPCGGKKKKKNHQHYSTKPSVFKFLSAQSHLTAVSHVQGLLQFLILGVHIHFRIYSGVTWTARGSRPGLGTTDRAGPYYRWNPLNPAGETQQAVITRITCFTVYLTVSLRRPRLTEHSPDSQMVRQIPHWRTRKGLDKLLCSLKRQKRWLFTTSLCHWCVFVCRMGAGRCGRSAGSFGLL